MNEVRVWIRVTVWLVACCSAIALLALAATLVHTVISLGLDALLS